MKGDGEVLKGIGEVSRETLNACEKASNCNDEVLM